MDEGWRGANKIKCVDTFFQEIQEYSKAGGSEDGSILHYWKTLDNLYIGLNSEAGQEADFIGHRDPQKDKAIVLCERGLEQYQQIQNAVSQMTKTLESFVADFKSIAERCDETQELITKQQ